jgi:hypothetical protein
MHVQVTFLLLLLIIYPPLLDLSSFLPLMRLVLKTLQNSLALHVYILYPYHAQENIEGFN